MKGDFSKQTFNAKKHFHDVLLQQGRVLLDSEWNEQKEITNHRIETETKDVIGAAGAPIHNDGFEIIPVDAGGSPASPGIALKIGAGRFYIDGILCENEEDVLFALQPDYNKTPLPSTAGTYLFYLDAWQRHITWLEDDDIKEKALNGPDTTTRSKVIWQVKWVNANGKNNCREAEIPEAVIPTGKMKARTELASGSADPCGLVTSGGYRRLENQLYRVEIHRSGNKNTATFKWSRDNGSVVVKWVEQDTNDHSKFIVSSTGRDELLGFSIGNWVEIVDEATELLQQPGILVQVSNVDGNIITINPASIVRPDGTTGGSVPVWTDYNKPRIRRWDMIKEAGAPGTDKGEIPLNKAAWIKLEDGVEVDFAAGNYRSGDYWLIPARTNTGKIEWSPDVYQSPRGVEHHYAKLAIATLVIGSSPAWTRDSDCRNLFPPLIELFSLTYAGGDGQEAAPLSPVAAPLMACLTNGQWPVAGADITFEVIEGNGLLTGNVTAFTAKTNAEGIASCNWTLGPEEISPARQVVRARYIRNTVQISSSLYFTAKLIPPELCYVSGDGQEGEANSLLDDLISAGVSYEQLPAFGRNIKFEIISGGGSVCLPDGSNPAPLQTLPTGPDGIASCKWMLGNAGEQQLKATLLNAAGNPMHIPIIYNADFVTSGKKRCSVSVGRKGDYPTLIKAFESLKGERNICICLLPSELDANGNEMEHRLDTIRVIEKDFIKITGCGATIRLIGKGMFLSADKIVLDQVNFLNTEMDKQQIVLESADVMITGCNFQLAKPVPAPTAPGAPEDILTNLYITPSRRRKESGNLRFSGNFVQRGIVFNVAAAMEVWLENNELEGSVILQSPLLNTNNNFPFEINPKVATLQWARMDEQMRKQAESSVARVSIVNRNEALYVRNNRIGRLLNDLGKDLNLPADLFQNVAGGIAGAAISVRGFQNIFVTENIFTSYPGSLSGDNIVFSNNQLLAGVDNTNFFLMGHSGIVMGNISPRNLGPIETIFDTGRAVRNPNLCPVF